MVAVRTPEHPCESLVEWGRYFLEEAALTKPDMRRIARALIGMASSLAQWPAEDTSRLKSAAELKQATRLEENRRGAALQLRILGLEAVQPSRVDRRGQPAVSADFIQRARDLVRGILEGSSQRLECFETFKPPLRSVSSEARLGPVPVARLNAKVEFV
jgi:hypothetical protein